LGQAEVDNSGRTNNEFVPKLLEYEIKDGKAVQENMGNISDILSVVFLSLNRLEFLLRSVILFAAHADEGNLVKRSTEAYIVHHADFMTFLPFKNKGS
jgi:hypothetical protein